MNLEKIARKLDHYQKYHQKQLSIISLLLDITLFLFCFAVLIYLTTKL